MADDSPSGPRPGPVVLRIKLRYDDVEAMAQRFAANVGKAGLFLPTKSLQPVGAEVKFELRLANDTPVIMGLGRVKAARPPDPANPRAAFGMAIELMRVTRESRDVILKLLERRKQLGLPEVAIPLPEAVDAARKVEQESGIGSAPKAAPTPAPAPAPLPPLRDSVPDAALAFTSPRRPTGPIAVAKTASVSPLAPEPARRRRAPISELIESASGRVVAVMLPGLDEDVDVAAVIARARALASGDLDVELEALRESAAAPIEISVDAASAELARQLGGAAVARDRSARWAPPPATAIPAAGPVRDEPPVVAREPQPEPEPELEPAATAVIAPGAPPDEEPASIDDEPDSFAQAEPAAIAAVEAALAELAPEAVDQVPEAPPEPTFTATATYVDAETGGRAERMATDRGFGLDDAEELDPDMLEPLRDSQPAIAVEPEQIADEVHRLSERDFEDVARVADAEPDPGAFDQHAFVTEPAVNAHLERSLDQQLAEADAEELGIAEAAARSEDEVQEIDDFEILAEADEADEDLLAANAEADAETSGLHHEIPSRPSDSDFASRLDLGDDDDDDARPPGHRQHSLAEIDPTTGELDPRMISAAHAIAAFDDDTSDEDTKAAVKRFQTPEPALHAFDQSDVLPAGPLSSLRGRNEPQRVRAPVSTADGLDLETALEALDVDLDDLSIPHAKTELPTSRGLPRLPRATSDDGVLIDFDDDD